MSIIVTFQWKSHGPSETLSPPEKPGGERDELNPLLGRGHIVWWGGRGVVHLELLLGPDTKAEGEGFKWLAPPGATFYCFHFLLESRAFSFQDLSLINFSAFLQPPTHSWASLNEEGLSQITDDFIKTQEQGRLLLNYRGQTYSSTRLSTY